MSSSMRLLLPWVTLFAALPAACGNSADAATADADAGAGAVEADGGDGALDAATERDVGHEDAAIGPPVACGTVLPGEPMKPGLTETQPGYAMELGAVDLSTVPDPFDVSAESTLGRGVVNFMLERSSGTTVTHAGALALGGIGKAVLGAAAKGQDGKIDFAFLRRGLHYHYPCTRPVPRDLGVFKSRYGDFATWPTTTIPCSKPKNGPRRLRENEALGIYVAETLVADVVRETEVIFTKLRDDGQLDFAAYTAEGELTDRSTFATASGGSVTSAAPYTCMSCHLDRTSGTFSVRFPAGTGAGCK